MAGVHGQLKGDKVYNYQSDSLDLVNWSVGMQCVNAPDPDDEEKWRNALMDGIGFDSDTRMQDALTKIDGFIRGRTKDIYRSYFVCVFAQVLFNFALLMGIMAHSSDKNDYSP
jgi:hypothetical protein